MSANNDEFRAKVKRLEVARQKAELFVTAGGDLKSKEAEPVGLELVNAFRDLARDFGYEIPEPIVQFKFTCECDKISCLEEIFLCGQTRIASIAGIFARRPASQGAYQTTTDPQTNCQFNLPFCWDWIAVTRPVPTFSLRALLQTGDPSLAEQQVRQALTISQGASLQNLTASICNSLGDVETVKGNFAEAHKNYENGLRIFTGAGDQPNIAASILSLGKLALEEGNALNAERMVRQAIQRFQSSKMPDDEADARSTLARALILQGKLADSQREIDIAAKLGAQDRIVRISLAVTAARLKAHTGRQAEARQDLDSLLNEAKEKNLVGLQLEVRLALADLDWLSDSKRKNSSVKALEQDAKNSGYLLVASKAEHLQASLSQ